MNIDDDDDINLTAREFAPIIFTIELNNIAFT